MLLPPTLDVAKILYKHEGPRFGLGSFKALGGAYAALRVLQREISRALGRDVAGLAALIAAARCEGLRGALGLDANSRVLLIGSEGVTDRRAFAANLKAGGEV